VWSAEKKRKKSIFVAVVKDHWRFHAGLAACLTGQIPAFGTFFTPGVKAAFAGNCRDFLVGMGQIPP